MGSFIDLTGKRFGRLTVIKRTESTNHNIKWLCKCDCGNEKSVFGIDLTQGKTASCGCIRKEMVIQKNTKHGYAHTRLHNEWTGIKQRCFNVKNQAYKNYGGRGITMCDEWKDNFFVFYEWAMNNGYQDDLTIDRIDNNGNYEPSNCRWTDRITQANNTRVNRRIEYKGETRTLKEWARIKNIGYGKLQARFIRGWTTEKALETP